MLRSTWFTLVLFVSSIVGPVFAADHDVIRLKKGTKLEGHCIWVQKNGLKIKLLDGEEMTVDIRTVEMIVFADRTPVRNQKLHVQQPPPVTVVETMETDESMPSPVNGLRGAYLAYGRDMIDKNSRPFTISKFTVVYVAMWPHGLYPRASVSVEGISPAHGYHDVNTFDLDPNTPVFMCKTFYDTVPGQFFADVLAKDCNWLIAVATSDSIASESDVESFGAELLQTAAYPPTVLTK